MSKPEDIGIEAWDKATETLLHMLRDGGSVPSSAVEDLARALLAAEQRGALRERELINALKAMLEVHDAMGAGQSHCATEARYIINKFQHLRDAI